MKNRSQHEDQRLDIEEDGLVIRLAIFQARAWAALGSWPDEASASDLELELKSFVFHMRPNLQLSIPDGPCLFDGIQCAELAIKTSDVAGRQVSNALMIYVGIRLVCVWPWMPRISGSFSLFPVPGCLPMPTELSRFAVHGNPGQLVLSL